MTGLATSPMPTDSRCTRIQNWLYDKRTTQSVKTTLWTIGGIGSIFVPVPFLNGMLTGSMIFMAMHEMLQHPNSICMRRCRPVASSRTWKHISAGAAICGVGWGLGMLALLSKMPPLTGPGLLGCIGGMICGFKVAYSDVLCPRGPQLVEEEAAVV